MALPGVSAVLRDKFSVLSRTDIPNGPRVLAIAVRSTANGTGGVADYDPYLATDEADVVTAFGDGSNAHRAFYELVTAGAQRIYIVALPTGTTDSTIASTATGNVLDLAFAAAETAQPDIIVPWGRGGSPTEWETPATPANEPQVGIYADNTTTPSTSLAQRVAKYCADISNRSHPVFGVMGVKPYINTGNSSPGLTAAQQANYLTFSNLLTKEDASWNGVGAFLTVVGTEVVPNNANTVWGYSNGACAYAGAMSQLVSWSSPTGKVAFNVSGLRWNPTRTQQQNMVNLGVMPVALDFNRIPRWIDAATFTKNGSDYTRLTTVRIINDAISVIRQISAGFIGESASTQHRNALETAITSGLRSMQQAGALLASDFTITYNAATNSADIDLVLQPAFEIRTINITVSVQL
jgi:hypothetical protein